MEVSGTAGSGKIFLIKFCVQQATVYLIAGVTLYIFLLLPTQYRGKDMSFPDESLRETLKDNCSNFRSILVDKRSLIGSTTYGWIS